MSLVISVDETDGLTVVSVGGELDMNTAPELLGRVTGLLDGGHQRLVLDLAGLSFCDSAGLSVLARVKRRVGELDGALILARPGRIVRSVLDMSGLAQVIPVYSTVEEAHAAARG